MTLIFEQRSHHHSRHASRFHFLKKIDVYNEDIPHNLTKVNVKCTIKICKLVASYFTNWFEVPVPTETLDNPKGYGFES